MLWDKKCGLLYAAAACLLASTTTGVAASPLDFERVERANMPKKGGQHWVATWTSMPQLVEPANLPPAPFNGSTGVFTNATLRQTLHTSIAAERIRIQISNIFGGSPLSIDAMSLAFPTDGLAGVGSIDTSTLRKLTFNGKDSVEIPVGRAIYADPIDVTIGPQTMVTVTLYTEKGQDGFSVTGHPGSRTDSWMSPGNLVNAANVTEASTAHWYFLTAIEAWAPKSTAALVILGDSISDGRESTDNENNRWPDLLLARMQQDGITDLAVVNQAAGGNAVLSGGNGPPLIQRYKRDLLQTAGAKYSILFEGVNDIGPAPSDEATQSKLVDNLESAFKTISSDAKKAGIKMFGATITPFGGEGQAYSSPIRERARQKLNAWILSGGDGSYAASIDFAKVVAGLTNPAALDSKYDSGDHLHPDPAGYQAMADRISLKLFGDEKAKHCS
ncbi:SGNH hydrolase-type esterase domain-containing protein [Xylaria sp. CBS 124048]|nr:SGNH hydrolase-type esterase domain-containing protein [Xylaria sp. CBS 124048]